MFFVVRNIVIDVTRLARFSVVGLLTALVYFGLLAVCVEIGAIDPVVASAACYIFAVLLNYMMHYHWTFSASGRHLVVVRRYFLMLFGGFILNLAVMFVGVSMFGWNYLLVQLVGVGLVASWNFTLSTFWVFDTGD